MTIRLASRRRLLAGAALLAPAAPTLAQTPLPPPAAERGVERPRSPPEALSRDHAAIGRVLLIYEAAVRRVGNGEDIEALIFTQTGEVMREFAHGHVEAIEEELIFPAFRKGGRMVALVEELQAQHGIGRQLTERIASAAEPARNSAAERTAMLEAMRALVTLYRPHLARKDTDILPTLRHLVTPKEYDEIARTIEARETERFGSEGFVKVVKKIEAIEKKIGIHDLGQFRPKT